MWPPAANQLQFTRFDNCAAAHLLNRPNIQKYWRIQEATGGVWIDLEQNVIDAAINEWRKCLQAEPMFVGQHFKHFCMYCRLLRKIDNCHKLLNVDTMCVILKKSESKQPRKHECFKTDRPTRWMYEFTSGGKSKLTMFETLWKSMPREMPDSLSIFFDLNAGSNVM